MRTPAITGMVIRTGGATTRRPNPSRRTCAQLPARPTLRDIPGRAVMLAQDSQTLNLRYHRLEVRNHWLVAITADRRGRTARRNRALRGPDDLQDGRRDHGPAVPDGDRIRQHGWRSMPIFAPNAIYVDHTGMVSTGPTEIKASVAMDQAFAPDILSIGSPTTTGSIVSCPVHVDNSLGLTGHGIQIASSTTARSSTAPWSSRTTDRSSHGTHRPPVERVADRGAQFSSPCGTSAPSPRPRPRPRRWCSRGRCTGRAT